MTLTNARLDELAAMEQAAYKGPWWRTDPPWGDGSAVHAGPSDDPHTAEIFVCTFDHFDQQFMRTFDGIDVDDIPDACKSLANLEFIASARNEFAAMIEQCKEANRLREAIEQIDLALRIPAAEYVPAIGDVFTIINSLKGTP